MADLTVDAPELVTAWFAAADEHRVKSETGVAAALFPELPDQTEQESYLRFCNLTTVGAILTGAALRKAHPLDKCPCGDPDHTPRYALAHPVSGREVDPIVAPPKMAAFALAVVAANEHGTDYPMLNRYITARVQPAATDDQLRRHITTLLDLLDLYLYHDPAGKEPGREH